MNLVTKLRQFVVITLAVLITLPTLAIASESRQRHIENRAERVVQHTEREIERNVPNTDDDESDEHVGDDEEDDVVPEHGHMGTVEAIEPVPTIDITVHKDPKAGYNLQIETTNYTFAPEHASTMHIPGEGHTHLYIDGVKITRVYGNWYYLGTLEPGEHTIRVELSANNHGAYSYQGNIIDDTEVVIVE